MKRAMTMGQKMLLWIKQHLKDEIFSDLSWENLTDSFRDGLILCGMIHVFSPQLLDYKTLDKSNKLENVRTAIRIFESEWSIPRIISPEDIHENPDDKSMQLFLSYVIKQAQVYEKLNPSATSGSSSTSSTPTKTVTTSTPPKTTTTTTAPKTTVGMFANRVTNSTTQPKTQEIKETPKPQEPKQEIRQEPKEEIKNEQSPTTTQESSTSNTATSSEGEPKKKIVKKIVKKVVTRVVKKDANNNTISSTTISSTPSTTSSTSSTTPTKSTTNTSTSSSSTGGFHSVDYLRTKPFGIDLSQVDQLLSSKDFEEVFGMTKEKWRDVPGWQKTAKRKQAGLF